MEHYLNYMGKTMKWIYHRENQKLNNVLCFKPLERENLLCGTIT